MMLSVALVALSLVASTFAGAVPSEPAPGTKFTIGQDCTIGWQPSTDGTGKTTYIQLMSGSNAQMMPVTTVTQIDATDSSTTSYTYKCPDVTLHANVYFYQFTSEESKADPNLIQWTGRFTISNGTVDPAPNKEILPDGTDASWGNGALVNQADVKPPPPTAPEGQGGSTTDPTDSTPSGSSTPTGSATKSSSNTGASGSATKSGSSSAASSTGSGTPTPTPTGGAVAWRGSAAAGVLAAGLVVALL